MEPLLAVLLVFINVVLIFYFTFEVRKAKLAIKDLALSPINKDLTLEDHMFAMNSLVNRMKSASRFRFVFTLVLVFLLTKLLT